MVIKLCSYKVDKIEPFWARDNGMMVPVDSSWTCGGKGTDAGRDEITAGLDVIVAAEVVT